MDAKETRFEWSKEVVLKGHGGVLSFVTGLGWVYSKEAEVAENLQELEDLEQLEALPGAEF